MPKSKVERTRDRHVDLTKQWERLMRRREKAIAVLLRIETKSLQLKRAMARSTKRLHKAEGEVVSWNAPLPVAPAPVAPMPAATAVVAELNDGIPDFLRREPEQTARKRRTPRTNKTAAADA